MVKGSLADRMEYAILELTMGHKDGTHQASWSAWLNSVGKLVPDLLHDSDLMTAFKRLSTGGIVRLTKTAAGRYHGFDYSGNPRTDEAFFFIADFNVTITDKGRTYWEGIKTKTGNKTIGF